MKMHKMLTENDKLAYQLATVEAKLDRLHKLLELTKAEPSRRDVRLLDALKTAESALADVRALKNKALDAIEKTSDPIDKTTE